MGADTAQAWLRAWAPLNGLCDGSDGGSGGWLTTRPAHFAVHIRCGRYTKLHVWNLVEFEKVVYIDADALVLQNVDELFSRPGFAAAPDVFPPDKFNAGPWSSTLSHRSG